MTDSRERLHAAFRLNLEQQKKRAKELLKAARDGDPAALGRFAATGSAQLADAQRLIAQDLGFASWTALKTHIATLARARRAISASRVAPDADRTTLHLRCGCDIRETLLAAGFRGEFLEHSYPYAHGPVTTAPDHLEREARFIATHAGPHMNVSFADALARRREEEAALASSATRYERIVLWMEHDCFDQLVLVRCLAHYASLASRPVLELVQTDRFPGTVRFIGLGQLPQEALRLLWERREPVEEATLNRAASVWRALSSDDPRELAAQMRSTHAGLPHLAGALRRLLQELPAVGCGLSLTERLLLEALVSGEPRSVQQVFGHLLYVSDPLPFATDFFLHTTIERVRSVSPPLLIRESTGNLWEDRLTITATGRQVLAGEADFLALCPSPRWVAGVEIRGDTWRWDERRNDVCR